MTQPLLLLPDELIVLTKDEVINTADIGRGRWQLKLSMDPMVTWATQSQFEVDCHFPAGTVFKVGAYRITRNTNPKYNQINLLVVHSPNKIWLPKSRGGTGRRTMLHLPVTTHFIHWSFERYEQFV